MLVLYIFVLSDNLSTAAVETSLKCWGSGSSGKLGSQGTSNLGDGTTEMGDNLSNIVIGTNIKVTKLATGVHTTVSSLIIPVLQQSREK